MLLLSDNWCRKQRSDLSQSAALHIDDDAGGRRLGRSHLRSSDSRESAASRRQTVGIKEAPDSNCDASRTGRVVGGRTFSFMLRRPRVKRRVSDLTVLNSCSGITTSPARPRTNSGNPHSHIRCSSAASDAYGLAIASTLTGLHPPAAKSDQKASVHT